MIKCVMFLLNFDSKLRQKEHWHCFYLCINKSMKVGISVIFSNKKIKIYMQPTVFANDLSRDMTKPTK